MFHARSVPMRRGPNASRPQCVTAKPEQSAHRQRTRYWGNRYWGNRYSHGDVGLIRQPAVKKPLLANNHCAALSHASHAGFHEDLVRWRDPIFSHDRQINSVVGRTEIQRAR